MSSTVKTVVGSAATTKSTNIPQHAHGEAEKSSNFHSTAATADSPRFMGLTGRPLSLAVSAVATTGFLLFGYDRKLKIYPFGDSY